MFADRMYGIKTTNGGFIAVVITAVYYTGHHRCYSKWSYSANGGLHPLGLQAVTCARKMSLNVIKACKPRRKHVGMLMCLLLSDVKSR